MVIAFNLKMDFPSTSGLIIKCKSETSNYMTRPNHVQVLSNYFLQLCDTKQTVNVCKCDDFNTFGVIGLKVNTTNFIQIHKFLSKRNLFLYIEIEFSFLEFFLKQENENLFFYIFNKEHIEYIYCHDEELYFISLALKKESLEKIMCIMPFYLTSRLFDPADYIILFSIVCERGELYLVETFYKEWNLSVKCMNKCIKNAVKSGNLEVVKFLIQNGANISLKKKLIKIAMINNYVDIFNCVFYPKIDKVYVKDAVFVKCMEMNNVEIIYSILSKAIFGKAWINCMFCNCYKSSSEVAELFVCAGANIRKYGRDVLEKASETNNKDLIGYLEKIV